MMKTKLGLCCDDDVDVVVLLSVELELELEFASRFSGCGVWDVAAVGVVASRNAERASDDSMESWDHMLT